MLLTTTAPPLRSALFRSIKFTPFLLPPTATTTTTALAPLTLQLQGQQCRPKTTSHYPRTPLTKTPRTYTPLHLTTRPASTAASPAATPTTTTTQPPTPHLTWMTWNAFLALRRTRRRYNTLASVLTSLLSTSAGMSVLMQQNFESLALFGMDPLVVLGAATAGSAAAGWLVGPFVGEAVFGVVYRGVRGEIAAKEVSLYRRIAKHRVDPSSSSAGNPVPDYYGEKIGSVAEYRTWMKDQRAYNKRRQNFL